MSTSPLQIVKEKHTSKDKLVEALLSKLEKKEGESKDDFKKRILSVSNTQLLRLERRFALGEAKPKKTEPQIMAKAAPKKAKAKK